MAISLHFYGFKALASEIIHILKYKLNKKTLVGFGIADAVAGFDRSKIWSCCISRQHQNWFDFC